ncbi:hypothetical protein G3N57_11910 [Paraburkholderia sp. Se-20369]|nr:hypothetical protein [Paraburkholderia sp. Se-20369]
MLAAASLSPRVAGDFCVPGGPRIIKIAGTVFNHVTDPNGITIDGVTSILRWHPARIVGCRYA